MNRRELLRSGVIVAASIVLVPSGVLAWATPEAGSAPDIADKLSDFRDANLIGFKGKGAARVRITSAAGAVVPSMPWLTAYGIVANQASDATYVTYSMIDAIKRSLIRQATPGLTVPDPKFPGIATLGGTDQTTATVISTDIPFLAVGVSRDAMIQVIYGPVLGMAAGDIGTGDLSSLQASSIPHWGDTAKSLLPTSADLPDAIFSEVETISHSFGS